MEWNKIRKDYIAGKGSYRELAKKYNVPLKTLAMRAKAEGWPELRKQSCHKAATKTVEAVAEANSRVDTRIYRIAGKLMDKLETAVDELDMDTVVVKQTIQDGKNKTTTERKTLEQRQGPIDRDGMQQLTGILRELKTVMDVRSALDMEEQRARIEALRAKADAGNEDDDDTGVIMLAPRMEGNNG